jgi:hypothetical protein
MAGIDRVVDQDKSRSSRRHPGIGGLHQLSTGCMHRSREMANLVCCLTTHVEQIETAAVVLAPGVKCRQVDTLNTVDLGHFFGRRLGLSHACGRHIRT